MALSSIETVKRHLNAATCWSFILFNFSNFLLSFTCSKTMKNNYHETPQSKLNRHFLCRPPREETETERKRPKQNYYHYIQSRTIVNMAFVISCTIWKWRVFYFCRCMYISSVKVEIHFVRAATLPRSHALFERKKSRMMLMLFDLLSLLFAVRSLWPTLMINASMS